MSLEMEIVNEGVWHDMMNNMRLPMMAGPTRDFLEGDVVDYFKQVTEKRFQSQGSDVGGWAALREFTVKDREAKGFPGASPINTRTGQLRRWMTQNTSPKSEGDSTSGYEVVYPGKSPNSKTEEKLRYAQEVPVGNNNSPRSVNILFPEHADVVQDLYQSMIEDTWRGIGVI